MAWKMQERDTLVDNRWLKVYRDKVYLDNGRHIDDYYTVKIPQAVGIIAVKEDHTLVLKKEYRYPSGRDLIQFPAGAIEQGEQILHAAQRELLEETGYHSEKWTYLGGATECSAKLCYTMHMFLAENCIRIKAQCLDDTQTIEVLEVSVQQAEEMILNGSIDCSTTVHALWLAKRKMSI